MADKKFATAEIVDGRPVAKVREHTVTMKDGEPTPVDLLLVSLGGCATLTLQAIMEKKRLPVESIAVDIEGTYAEERPPRLETISMAFRVKSPGLDQRELDATLELSERYCPVHQTLHGGTEITVTGEVIS